MKSITYPNMMEIGIMSAGAAGGYIMEHAFTSTVGECLSEFILCGFIEKYISTGAALGLLLGRFSLKSPVINGMVGSNFNLVAFSFSFAAILSATYFGLIEPLLTGQYNAPKLDTGVDTSKNLLFTNSPHTEEQNTKFCENIFTSIGVSSLATINNKR